MTSKVNHPPTQIRIRPETRALIDALASRYRLTITEATALAVEHFSNLNPTDQMQAIQDRTDKEAEAA